MRKANKVDIMLKMWEYEKKFYDDGFKVIAGTDEAGRGPLAGPVVAAAVVLERDTALEGINDSKKLSESARDKLYDMIIDRCVCYSVSVISHERIDETNILRASLAAMSESVGKLSVKPDIVLVDGNRAFECDIPLETIVKGDSKSISIAAASILAKVTRDRIMLEYDKMYPQYDFKKHKGYPTPEHRRAIAEYGASPIHRKTFKLI